jgi:hypothetical protein
MSIPAALLRYSPVLDHTNYILGAGAGSLVPAGRSLVAIHDWTFLLGPGSEQERANGLAAGAPSRPS